MFHVAYILLSLIDENTEYFISPSIKCKQIYKHLH